LTHRNICTLLAAPLILFSALPLHAQTTTTTQTVSLSGGTLTYSQSTSTWTCYSGPPSGSFYTVTVWGVSGMSFTAPNGVTSTFPTGPQGTYADSGSGTCPGVTTFPTVLTSSDQQVTLSVSSINTGASFGFVSYNDYIKPKYQVVTVIYAAPGNNSYVDYGTTTDVGATSSVSYTDAHSTMTTMSVSVGGNGKLGIGATASASLSNTYTQEQDSGNSIAVDQIMASDLKTTFAGVPLNHDNDVIRIWLNPALTLSAPTVTGPYTWTGYEYDQNDPNGMDVISLTVAQIKAYASGTTPIGGRLARIWDPVSGGGLGGLTPQDFATILQRDPFASGGVNLPAGRFTLVDQFNFLTGTAGVRPDGTFTLTETYKNAASFNQAVVDSTATKFEISVKGSLGPFFSSSVTKDTTITVTYKQASSQTYTTSQTATVQIQSPAATDNYTGPTLFNVYQDTLYGTFLFVPINQGLTFVPINPCRPVNQTTLAGNTSASFTISGTCGIPANAVAYSLNFTVVPAAGLGYLAAWPAGQSQPGTSILNSDGRVKANAAIMPAGTGGAITVFASDTTGVIVDANGYFLSPTTGGPGSLFSTVTPCRIVDTRTNSQTLSANQTRSFQVGSACGIPSSATAYSLNVTAVPKAGLSYLTLFPTGQPQPFVSTLNSRGNVVANAAIIAAGQNGQVSVFATDPTDVILDINGYYGPTGTYAFNAITPCRAVDTRLAQGAFTGTLVAPLGASSCVFGQSNVVAYALNATVVPQGGLGFLSLYPDSTTWPGTSTLNSDGSITSNFAVVPTINGSLDALAAGGTTNLILDISGYFSH